MFSPAAWDVLESFADVKHHQGQDPATKADLLALLGPADACITSWGVACLDAEVMAAAPRLRAVAHMGSSVKRFVSDALWDRGVHLTSAGVALAREVAETTLGLMITARKGIWTLARRVRSGGWDQSGSRELNRCTVGIVGASNVGRHLISLLKAFDVEVLCHDPYLDPVEAERLGVSLVALDDLMRRSDIVSLHCPANESTRHLVNAGRLRMMRDDAILINTARGTLVDEEALVGELSRGRLFAMLDVTDPEPPAADSSLRTLDNVVLTPHIAGCIENCHRLGELAVEELRRFFAGEPAIYAVTKAMLDRIA
jgi:phosphoglycerate dehydrogenase-like enzyme